MQKTLSIIIGVAIVVGVGGFYGGMKYTESKIPTRFSNMPGGSRMARDARGNFGVRGDIMAGEIISKDEKIITIKLREGGSRIIFLGVKTSIAKTVDGTTTDLVIGKQVTVMGSENSDGSITAESVQLRNSMVVSPSSDAK